MGPKKGAAAGGGAGAGPAAGKQRAKQKSPAEFFAENKIIAGFDTPGKSLYTTVRELVENSLDAAERCGVLPCVGVRVEEVGLGSFNRARGVEERERTDSKLYKDTETVKERLSRERQEARERALLEKEAKRKSGKTGGSVETILRRQEAARRGAASRMRSTFYRVTCKDNGSGMPHSDIPNMLGRVLSSTKYDVVQQTRGKFGLGAKMALIWAKMSTGQPVEVWSARMGQGYTSHYVLDMDIQKNEPRVLLEEKLPHAQEGAGGERAGEAPWHGTEVRVVIEGNWSNYRAKLLRYLKLIAIITPYAEFTFLYEGEGGKGNIANVYQRRTDSMPPPPEEGRYHPSCVDLELLRRLLQQSKQRKLASFLSKEFCSIPPAYAQRLVAEMGGGLGSDSRPKALTENDILSLHQFLQQVRFSDPDGGVLRPAGEYNLRLGVMKELHPQMVATYQGDPRAHEGHAFTVEAAVCLGAKDSAMEAGQVNVFRFANRIPLLFEGGNDVITKTANQVKWGRYKISLDQKVGVFVSIVSTKVPFKGTSKEYIGDIAVIGEAVKHALNQCGLQLRVKLVRQEAAKERKDKKKSLAKYIPDAARAVGNLLEMMAEREDPPGPKRRRREEEAGEALVPKVRVGLVTKATLTEALTKYVDKLNTEGGLEYQMQAAAGDRDREKPDVFLRRRVDAPEAIAPELRAPLAALRLTLAAP